MKKFFYKGDVIFVDCPEDGAPATVTDDGLVCSDPNCPNS